MEDEEYSVDLQVCVEDEKEDQREEDEEEEEVVMHVSEEDEEAMQVTPNQTSAPKPPPKTTEAKERAVKYHNIKLEPGNIVKVEEVEEVEEKVENESNVQKKKDKSFPCLKCGLVSGSLANLKKHIMTHTGERPFKCRTCLKSFRQRHHLVDHWRTHSGERPFKCEECGKHFVQKSSLNLHKKKHYNSKAFSCNECDYATHSKAHLIIHMRTHTGEKPFQCEKCGQTFSSSTRLKYHRMIHTGERRYKCDQCGVPFREKSTLQAHYAVHLNVGPFLCEECGQEFPRLASLSLHRRVHARKEEYLYVYNKEANKSFDSAVQKTSCKVNPLKRKRAQENEKSLSSSGVRESDPGDAGESDELPSKAPGQEMSETVTHRNQQISAIPAKASVNYMLSLSPEDKAAQRSKLSLCPSNSDQHKLKESLALNLKYSVDNSYNINPDQVREALKRGTVLETHSDGGKGFFIVLPPALQNKDIMVISDPCESTTAASIHIPDSNVMSGNRNPPSNILCESVLETDKVPYPSTEEEVRECEVDSVGMEEEVCSDGEGEMVRPCETEPVKCILNASGPEDELDSWDGYSEAIEEQLHPDGESLLLWKDNGSNKLTKVTYIIEDGKRDPIVLEEECFLPQHKDKYPSPKTEKQNLKEDETLLERGEKNNSLEPGKHIKTLKKSRITKAKIPRVYNCEQCGKACKSSSKYIAHLRIHSGERPYYCDVCNLGFKQISHLKSHIRTHTGERPYVCGLCNAAFTQSSRLTAHKKSLHPKGQVEIKEKKKKHVPENRIKNFFCRFCNKTFIGECLKVDHMKLHQSSLSFMCKLCGMQFKTKSSMQAHVMKHSDFKHICELCGIEVASLYKLQCHKVTEHGISAPDSDRVNMYIVKIGDEEDFMVLNPAMRGGQENQLSTLVKVEDSRVIDPSFCDIKQEIIHVTDVDGNLKTEIQEVTTQGEGEIAIHDITHTSPEKDKNTTQKKNISGPVVNTSNGISSSCDDLQKVVREGEIKEKRFITYIDEDSGKKMWMCKECDRSFTQSSNLYCHMRMHTGDKPFQCNVCSKAFRQITHLKDHMRRHTGAKPHVCSACGKCFTQRSAARRHIMVMHGGEGVPERIPESQIAREIINTLSNERDRPSRGSRKTAVKRKDASPQGGDSCELPQKENVLHVCKVCNKQFTHSASLGAHSRRCGKHKNWKASQPKEKCECGETFVSQIQLLKHQKSCSVLDDETGSVETERNERRRRKFTSRSDDEEDDAKDVGKTKYRVKKSLNSSTQVSGNSFPCKQCDETLSSIASLKAHMEGHSGEVQQLCTICGETFKRASALRYHQSMKHGREDRRYKDYCPTGYVSVKEEYPEEEIDVGEEFMEESESECKEMCRWDTESDEEEEMISDVEVDTKETPSMKTASSSKTKQGLSKRGALKTISNKVGRVTKTLQDSDTDEVESKDNGAYICSACGATFTRSSKLKHHKANWCKGEDEPDNADGKHKSLKENSPSRVNKVSRKAENQRKDVASKKTERLSDSSSSTATAAASSAVDGKDDVEQSDVELYCEDCDSQFPDKGSYEEHMPIHKIDGPFKCEHCSMMFKRKAHLFNHYRRHVSLEGVECL